MRGLPDRWLVLTAMATLVVLLISVGIGVQLPHSGHRVRLEGHRGAPCAAPDPQNPIFSRVEGNHLLDTRRQVIMPYGVTLDGLARPHWQQTGAGQEWLMRGAITEWCTNFIRLQLSPSELLARSPYDPDYVRAIESQVAYAASWNQNVILAAQTEKAPVGPAGPTARTVRFWKTLAPLFKTDPRVWFDLFDAPRLKAGPDTWQIWQQGGRVGGRTYVGMQQLVDVVRATGASNLIFAEGPYWDGTLAALPGHELSGANIAYAVHADSAHTPAQWDVRFGNASATVPVLDDQWSQSAVARACSPDAGTWVPQLLAYLRQHQIGLGVGGFHSGVLLTSTQSFTPTTITSQYACQRPGAKDAAGNTEGAGQLVEQYFRTYSRS